MLDKLSIIGAAAAILMIPTALSAQMGGAINPGVHVGGTVNSGKRCLILGGRQSAFEWAALIRQAGAAAVHVCHRHETPAFTTADWAWVNPLVNLIAKELVWFRKLSAAAQEDVTYRLWAEGRLKVEPWLEPRVLKDGIKLWPKSQFVGCVKGPDGALAVKLDNGETVIVVT
jgi:hypothetical protein